MSNQVHGPLFGPTSFVSAHFAVVLIVMPLLAGRDSSGFLVGLALFPLFGGIVLSAIPGTARRIGVGLLVGCLTLPVALLTFALVGSIG